MTTSVSAIIRFIVLLLAVALTACRSSTPPLAATTPSAANVTQPGGRYTLKNDVPVLETLDVSKIKPVIPHVEPRTQAGNRPYTIDGHVYNVLKSEAGYTEVGMASWYGRKFQGFLTANGEKYDMFQLSAAHTTLPIPSYAKVTNLDNGKSVVVRVNDRGPFHPGRIIDMSYAAAVMLGYAGSGTARVKVESIVPDGARSATRAPAPVETSPVQPVNPPVSVENFAKERQLIEAGRGADYLQIGAFGSEKSALALQTRLQTMTKMPIVIHTETAANGMRLYKVRVGPLADDVQQVQALQDAVAAAKMGTPFKVRI